MPEILEQILVAVLVTGALLFLVRQFLPFGKGKRKGGGCSAGCCEVPKANGRKL